MTMRGRGGIALIAAVVLLAGLAVYAGLGDRHRDSLAEAAANAPQVPVSQESDPALSTVATTEPAHPLAAQDLPQNDRPPDPAILVDRPDLQQAFDDNAQPGEFVTPPSVSSE